MNLPPHTQVWELALERETTRDHAALCLTTAAPADLAPCGARLLAAPERDRWRQFRSETRGASYLCGRIAAKVALGRLRPAVDGATVAVLEGVFGQPVFSGVEAAGLQVTISHAPRLGGALVFPESHPLGLDIEAIRPEHDETIRTQLTERERDLLRPLPLAPSAACALLWTVKESLSKVLKCGLTASMTLFEVDAIDTTRSTLVSTFTHFAQYRTLSVVYDAHVVSVTLPKKTVASLDFLAGAPR